MNSHGLKRQELMHEREEEQEVKCIVSIEIVSMVRDTSWHGNASKIS